jgi:alpha-beta hydrolase superfamily lysophospholipase
LKHTEGWLELRHTSARGTSRLYQQSWLPEQPARANLMLAHGLGEHSSRYEYFAAHCTARGIAVHAIDHYGHGRSEGLPGHVERFSVYLDGVRTLRDDVRSRDGGLPLFLLGHSMGGLIAAAFLGEDQSSFRGCILSGPALKSDVEPPALVMAIARLISWLAPTAPLIGLDPAGVSRDPAVVSAYVNDPLVHHGKATARLVTELSATMRATLEAAPAIKLPLLVLHGDADVLTSPAGSQALHDAAGSADKTLKLYPGLYHEIFNEPERDQVLGDMSAWLEARL